MTVRSGGLVARRQATDVAWRLDPAGPAAPAGLLSCWT